MTTESLNSNLFVWKKQEEKHKVRKIGNIFNSKSKEEERMHGVGFLINKRLATRGLSERMAMLVVKRIGKTSISYEQLTNAINKQRTAHTNNRKL